MSASVVVLGGRQGSPGRAGGSRWSARPLRTRFERVWAVGAAHGAGNFFGDPVPVVSLKAHRAKEAWEREWLQRWS